MARTKADAGKKAGGKAPRKAPVLRNTPSASGGVKKSKSRSSAGSKNSVCKRPVPKWQVSVKDLAWMKAGSSKDEEPEVIDLVESNGSTATTVGDVTSSSGDEESGFINTENCEESIDEENGVEDENEEENGTEEGEIERPDSKDIEESMEEDGEVCLAEDVKGEGVKISDNQDEVSTTGDLVKRDEDASLGEKVGIEGAVEKVLEEVTEELGKNDEISEIPVKGGPKEISDAEVVAEPVKEAEEIKKDGETVKMVVKDPEEISGEEKVAEMHEENAGDTDD